VANNSVLPVTLDDFFQSSPLGSLERAIGNNLYGFNHRQVPGMVPTNKDHAGFTFFVRPQLNLQGDNIRNVRLFYPLLTQNRTSVQTLVRTILDPRLLYSYGGTRTIAPAIQCPVVDPLQAFIPFLTNDLVTVTGWPDMVVMPFVSKAGLYQESYAQVDSLSRNYSEYDLDVTFKNTRGDPIVYLFWVWIHYASLVFEGRLVPYPDFLLENEIDYTTRIYRLTLDPYKTHVRKIAATGVAFPISNPLGQFFDYTNERPYNEQTKDITVRFKCLGMESMDGILVYEFNRSVQIFNPDMRDGVRETSMVALDSAAAGFFNNRGYPRINPNDYKLEWWVPKQLYQQRLAAFTRGKLVNENLKSPGVQA
jgi:hypothetical protein